MKQLEDSRTRTNDIVRHSVDGLIVINREGTVETFNPACERMFGYQAHEVIGKNVTALISENDAAWSDERQNADQFSVESGAVSRMRFQVWFGEINLLCNNEESFLKIWTSRFAIITRTRLNKSDRNFSPCNVCDVDGTLIGKTNAEYFR